MMCLHSIASRFRLLLLLTTYCLLLVSVCTMCGDTIVLASLMSYKFVYDFGMHHKVMTWMCIVQASMLDSPHFVCSHLCLLYAFFCSFYFLFFFSFFVLLYVFSLSFVPSIQSTRSTNANFFHTFEHSMGCNFKYGIYIFRIRFAFMHMRCHTHSRSILSTNDTQREVEKNKE